MDSIQANDYLNNHFYLVAGNSLMKESKEEGLYGLESARVNSQIFEILDAF